MAAGQYGRKFMLLYRCSNAAAWIRLLLHWTTGFIGKQRLMY